MSRAFSPFHTSAVYVVRLLIDTVALNQFTWILNDRRRWPQWSDQRVQIA